MQPGTEEYIVQKITPRWVKSFFDRFQIVSRDLTRKLQLSAGKEAFIFKKDDFHLGELSRQFSCGELNEDDVRNSDKTQFVINLES